MWDAEALGTETQFSVTFKIVTVSELHLLGESHIAWTVGHDLLEISSEASPYF